jgi:hypothetical protein
MSLSDTAQIDLFEAGRLAGLRDAAAIARDVKRRETDLHQDSFDKLPENNRFFVYGANRAAEHIEAALNGELIGAPDSLSRYSQKETV